MACKDCFNNCDPIVTDKCVQYTGPDIEFLGICNGDRLSDVEAAIIEKLSSALDGTGISLSEFTPCTFVKTYLGSSKEADKIAQSLNDAICELKTEIVALQNTTTTPLIINADCLTDLPSSPTRDDILASVAKKLCSTVSDVAAIKEDYVKSSELCSLVQSCITESESGTLQENTKLPKYCPIPYYGPLTVFDGSGAGISAMGYDKVYLCIGQTIRGFAIPDLRGRTLVGANVGVPGGTMDAAVDPSQVQNAGYGISKGAKKGEFAHTLTVVENAPHTHPLNDPGHTHTDSTYLNDSKGGDQQNTLYNSNDTGATPITRTISSNTTGITIGSSGGGQPHNTMQPSIGTYFIIYIP